MATSTINGRSMTSQRYERSDVAPRLAFTFSGGRRLILVISVLRPSQCKADRARDRRLQFGELLRCVRELGELDVLQGVPDLDRKPQATVELEGQVDHLGAASRQYDLVQVTLLALRDVILERAPYLADERLDLALKEVVGLGVCAAATLYLLSLDRRELQVVAQQLGEVVAAPHEHPHETRGVLLDHRHVADAGADVYQADAPGSLGLLLQELVLLLNKRPDHREGLELDRLGHEARAGASVHEGGDHLAVSGGEEHRLHPLLFAGHVLVDHLVVHDGVVYRDRDELLHLVVDRVLELFLRHVRQVHRPDDNLLVGNAEDHPALADAVLLPEFLEIGGDRLGAVDLAVPDGAFRQHYDGKVRQDRLLAGDVHLCDFDGPGADVQAYRYSTLLQSSHPCSGTAVRHFRYAA